MGKLKRIKDAAKKLSKSKGGKVAMAAGRIGLAFAKKSPVGTALAVGGAALGVAKFVKGKLSRKGKGEKRRKGLVPKTVRKWTTKLEKRRKAQDKVIRKMLSGSGILAKMRKNAGSPGFITQAERAEALRK